MRWVDGSEGRITMAAVRARAYTGFEFAFGEGGEGEGRAWWVVWAACDKGGRVECSDGEGDRGESARASEPNVHPEWTGGGGRSIIQNQGNCARATT